MTGETAPKPPLRAETELIAEGGLRAVMAMVSDSRTLEKGGASLGEDSAAAVELLELLRPYPSEAMRAYLVSTAVNIVKNDGPGLMPGP
jgi:hypothetical protein